MSNKKNISIQSLLHFIVYHLRMEIPALEFQYILCYTSLKKWIKDEYLARTFQYIICYASLKKHEKN